MVSIIGKNYPTGQMRGDDFSFSHVDGSVITKEISALISELDLSALSSSQKSVPRVSEVTINLAVGAEGKVSILGFGGKASVGASIALKVEL